MFRTENLPRGQRQLGQGDASGSRVSSGAVGSVASHQAGAHFVALSGECWLPALLEAA